MGEDEAGTVKTLTAYREIMAELIKQHRGRVVDFPGDNLLAEFSSVVEAVECAVEIQMELKGKNEELPENRRMEFRIGINLGDVIEGGDRIYGDGVNVAARIEGLADAGGIYTSGTAYDQVENKLPLAFEYLGEQSVKNIKKPIRVYRVQVERREADSDVSRELRLPERPSIAVLPFVNMSGDPQQEYFSDGITEEIITGLSKIPRLFVTARNSSFAYKAQPVKVPQVGRELGVHYVLEGSVRKAGDRVRVSAQLIDVMTDKHIWAERYDRELKDIFAIQDEITMNIMIALQVKLTDGDQAAQEAISLAPEYSSAYAGLASTYLLEPWHGWSASPAQSLELAMQYAQKCLALDESFSDAHATLGLVHLVMQQWEKAIEECELAVSLNPNGADNIAILAVALKTVGRVEEALAMLEKAIRLNPMPPDWLLHEFGSCYRLMGRYDEAIAALRRVLDGNPDYLNSRLNLIATYVMSGKEEAARAEGVEVLRRSPDFSVERFLRNFPYKDQKIIDGLKEYLLKAGLK
jgi:adenylate cyclase